MENEVNKKNKKEKIGILIGFILILVAIFILFLNESKSVDSERVISIAKDSYIEVSSSKIDKNNDGKLVVTSGKIDLINDSVSDQDFNVSVKTAKLVRTVEMYQWSEKCEDSENGKETCTYTKNWSNTIIDDTNFESGHVNPDTMPYSSSELYMCNVNLGEYILDVDLLQQLSTNKKYTDLDEKVAKSKDLNIIDGEQPKLMQIACTSVEKVVLRDLSKYPALLRPSYGSVNNKIKKTADNKNQKIKIIHC